MLALFQWDHNVFHAWDGSDLWHNLTPLLIAVHREKSKSDTSKVAKTKRISAKWEEFTRNMTKPRRPKTVTKKIVSRCKLCNFKVRSSNSLYIKVRMERHNRAKHP